MPRQSLALNETAAIGLPDAPPAIQGCRKSLVLMLESGTAYWGWTPTVTAAGATDAGIPLTVSVPIAFDAESFRMGATLKVFASAAAVIVYQENFHP